MPDNLRRIAQILFLISVGVLTGGVCLAGSISVDSLQNAAYPSGFAPDGEIRLHRGQFHDHFERRGEVRVEMTEHVAIGTLPDGRSAAAVVLRTTTGGNASFHDLTLMIEAEDGLRWAATAPLGDRVSIDQVGIDGEEVVVTLREHDRDDPMCCPSRIVETRFSIKGARLVARSVK